MDCGTVPETAQQPPELVTPRLRLRRLRRSDAGLIALYASDPDVARMSERIPHPYPPGHADTYVERVLSGAAGDTAWAIDIGGDTGDDLIGIVMLRPGEAGTAVLGYWVARAFWGAGYAGEAVEAVVGYAAGRGLTALTAVVFQDNPASVKVLTRANFAYVGAGEGYSAARGGLAPTFSYRLDLAGVAS
jgi:RimJ/RimL family protein N-acetyltransferase